jgi:hydrogenase/urease accessory protein HupE
MQEFRAQAGVDVGAGLKPAPTWPPFTTSRNRNCPRQPTSRVSPGVGALLALVLATTAYAHPLSPALLELRELDGGRVDVTWKTSLLTAPGAAVAPALPAECRELTPAQATSDGDSITRTWTVACGAAGLVGMQVGISGLGGANIDGLIRITLADGRVIRGVVRAEEPQLVVPARERRADVIGGYMRIGIAHILTGVDHLLFVAGLLLLVRGGWLLFETITAFTVGHSVTLTLAALDLVHVPARPIELCIALSVFVLAVELSRAPSTPPSLLRRRPWLMAFAFGLLHGLGFASALREVGLPAGDVPLALFAFNLGIEIGQVAFVAVLLSLAALSRRLRIRWPAWAEQVPLYTMGSLAAFWCFERAAALIR